MKATEYVYEWLDKKYGGSPEIEDWTPEDVIEFAEDYANHKNNVDIAVVNNTFWDKRNFNEINKH